MSARLDECRTVLAAEKATRLPGVDRMRGLVIVLMALDHVRLFLHGEALRFSPTDLAHTYPALFLTRFVTHYCAPTFALLAGVGAFLHLAKGRDPAKTRRFILSRGLWLIVLDVAFIGPIFMGGFGKIGLGTLWAIGGGLIALAALISLPARAVLAVGAAVLLFHDLLDGVRAADLGAFGPFWSLLHEPGALPFGLPGRMGYPILPWIGVVALGFGLGPLFLEDVKRRAGLFLRVGFVMLCLFLALRAGNFYGDPRPWSVQATPVLTALSFIDVSKYPPSLLYALVTIGPALMLTPLLERMIGVAGGVLADFGRTPLFFYVLHLYVLGAVALALGQAIAPENGRTDLLGVYLAWIALVAALYPLCRWFARLKRRRDDWWLSYL
jgi:uncharacterized membrane protein